MKKHLGTQIKGRALTRGHIDACSHARNDWLFESILCRTEESRFHPHLSRFGDAESREHDIPRQTVRGRKNHLQTTIRQSLGRHNIITTTGHHGCYRPLALLCGNLLVFRASGGVRGETVATVLHDKRMFPIQPTRRSRLMPCTFN